MPSNGFKSEWKNYRNWSAVAMQAIGVIPWDVNAFKMLAYEACRVVFAWQ